MIRYRAGIGYDVHRLVPERDLILGGVKIKSELGLLGHSDADVLSHAIIDALLGAAALGDIGAFFPDTDPRWKDANSLELLKATGKMLSDRGFEIENVDSTVVLESPRLRPHIDAMRLNLATALGIRIDNVGVKATTSERMGFTGREEGAMAIATCSIYSDSNYSDSNAGEPRG
jgi:2-C-methyl-D-erythritol 2,4-cyclodiphosphate synthase